MTPLDGQPILTAAEMRAAEAATGQDAGTLMARAGEALAAAVYRVGAGQEVLVLCGPGNNGGDGYVAAAALAQRGVAVRVAASADPRTDAARAARTAWHGTVERIADAKPAPVLLDALFGTGLARPLEEPVASTLQQLASRASLLIAVDVPSGAATDDGAMLSSHPGADLTLALGAAKPCHLLLPTADLCGEVRVLDIGIDARSSAAVLPRPVLAPPASSDHKFSRGMVAIVAGAMPGASALAARAASRIAGYTLLIGAATDRLPHAVVRRRWSADALSDERIGAVVVGPGLGRGENAQERLDAALASERPLVIDGDALRLLDLARLRGRKVPAILTPHGGEFQHLFGDGPGSRIDRARVAARESGATVVLKGADSVVAAPDGSVHVARHRCSWLATAGTGDVLAGLIGGLLAYGNAAERAAMQGVWLHTDAARRAGPSLIADDLAAALPSAIRSVLA